MKKVLILNGSPQASSRTATLLEHISSLLEKDYQTTLVHLAELGLPVNDPAYYHYSDDNPSAGVRELVRMVKETDTVILGTPLYHGSFSGLMKLALDNLGEHAFEGKAVGIASQSCGIRVSVQAAQHLALVANAMHGRVSHSLIGACMDDFTKQDGRFTLTSDEIKKRAEIFVQDLLALDEPLGK